MVESKRFSFISYRMWISLFSRELILKAPSSISLFNSLRTFERILRHLIVNTTTTKVSLWFVTRLKINFVFRLKFPFTSSDLGSEYRSHIFNTLCIILKLLPRRTLKVTNVQYGSRKFQRDFNPYTFSKSYLSGEWKMTCNICVVAILLH